MGLWLTYCARTPATKGEAIDVPLMTTVEEVPTFEAEIICDPGEKIVMQFPKLENEEMRSALSVEPTTIPYPVYIPMSANA